VGPSSGDDTVEAGLRRVLERSRAFGLLGDGPLGVHVDNAALFAAALAGVDEARDPGIRILDLGSGGGVPGLVLAAEWPGTRMTLLDSQHRRCEFLRWAVAELGIGERVEVAEGRAEDLAREPGMRAGFRAVLARSFGPPAVTAECAAGFLDGPGAAVLVSEPPGAVQPGRWPAEGLEHLGLAPGPRVERSGTGAVQVLVLTGVVPDRYPRRSGVPAKRPLF
jgi:16S rRNA (guanine527-N7)-methyltransferase